MKRWITMFAIAGLLAGCASTPKDEQPAAKVEDAAPPTTTTAPPPKKPTTDPTAKPIVPDTVACRSAEGSREHPLASQRVLRL